MVMKKILRFFGWVLVVLFVLFTFYFIWKQAQPIPVVYQLVKPEKRDLARTTVATGELVSRTQVELRAQITGTINELMVEAGDIVKRGDLIATISVIPDMNQLNLAQSEVEAARISLKEAKREAERAQRLYDKGVIGGEENERLQSSYETAQDRLDAALSQVEVITKGTSGRVVNVNTSEVRASMSGVVLSVPVKKGIAVSGSSAFSQGTTIATIANMNDIIFKGNIDETDVARLYVGMPIELVPGSMQEVKIPARLDYISPEGVMQNGTKMFEIKATVNIPKGVNIRSGYSVNAHIVLDKAANALSVDETCVEIKDDDAFVYRLISPENDREHQKWERIPVTIGVSDGLHIEIKSGIKQGDLLKGNISSNSLQPQ